SAIRTITARPYDLWHVRPDTIKTHPAELALVAHPLCKTLPRRRLIPYREHCLRRPERIAQPLVFIRLFHRHNVRIFLDTPHTPNTLVLQRLEPAKPSTKNPVDTRSTENNFLVELVLESLMHQHSRKPHLTRTHVKLVRNLIDMRSRFGLYLETLILRGLDGFRVQVPCPLQTHRSRGIYRTNISSL